jgi:hypothetical protein
MLFLLIIWNLPVIKKLNALLRIGTMPTLLPGAAFFLGMPDPPVRKMINAGLPDSSCFGF